MASPIPDNPPLGKVYFEPDVNIKLEYPCILYSRDQAKNHHADNTVYRHTKRYMVTIIDEDPDSAIADQVSALPMCIFSRHFATNGLNHDIYSLYF